MGSLYCEKIMATYQKILAQQPVEEIKPAPAEPVKEKNNKNKKKSSMKQRVAEILQEKK